MRIIVLASAVALAFVAPAVALDVLHVPIVLEGEEASLGMPDSTGYPMDGCCALHEEGDGYFLNYPPELWSDLPTSLQLPECEDDLHCILYYQGRIGREGELQTDLLVYLNAWYATDMLETPPSDMTAALERANTFSHEPLY